MLRVVGGLFAAGIGGKLKDIVNVFTRAAAELPSAPADSVIFASDSILTGGSMNYAASTIYTDEAATYFIYHKRNLMPNI